MRALLLAAGLGTRLRPVTDSLPKCLVDINGRPLLDYWIELLSNAGIVDILVNLHHMPEAVRSYIDGCRYPVKIATVYEERLLGTGGTLLKNNAFFRKEPLMLIHADNLSFFDVRAFEDKFDSRGNNIDMTMMTFHTDAPETCGIVEIDGMGVVRALHEKVRTPPGNLANAAVYILAPEVMDFVAGLDKEIIDFSTEVLPHFIGRINTFHNGVFHRDIGTLESLILARREYPDAVAGRRTGNVGGLPA
jgi:mannose-1-phosphate guanylyltransferase